MIAKIVLFFAVVAAAHATVLLNSGILAPRVLRSGLSAPLLSAPMATSSVIATPGAITTDRRIIGATGLISSLAYTNGIVSSGHIGAAPISWSNGIVTQEQWNRGIGLRSSGILSAPGLVRTILK